MNALAFELYPFSFEDMEIICRAMDEDTLVMMAFSGCKKAVGTALREMNKRQSILIARDCAREGTCKKLPSMYEMCKLHCSSFLQRRMASSASASFICATARRCFAMRCSAAAIFTSRSL